MVYVAGGPEPGPDGPRAPGLDFALLGPLEVVDGDASLTPRRHKPRALLVALLLRPGRVVTVEALIEAVWGGDLPASARNLIHGYVSDLRRDLDDPDGRLLRTVPGGYLLEVPPQRVDAHRFERLVAAARRCLARAPERAAALLREALALWRGPALADLAGQEFVQAEIRRLEELRRSATELRLRADLARGRHGEIIGELEHLLAAEPLRESAWETLALAYYRSRRQAEALTALARARQVLRDELGVDPGPELAALERRILTQDSSLDLPVRVSPPANLPSAVSELVGRGWELEEAVRLLADRRLVSLTGPGGCGKTRLAVEVVRRVSARFPDGVWFVDLGPVADGSGRAAVVARLGEVLGLRAEPDRSLADSLLAYLAPRRVLVVLDNCERVVGAAADLAHRILSGSRHVRVLATSREVLRAPGEAILPLTGLAGPPPGAGPEEVRRSPAGRLFADRAAEVRPGFRIDALTAEPVGTICRALDGLPLALELAAARVRSLSPQQIADRLSDRFALLTRGARTGPARHRTLHAAVNWSYGLLEDDERAVLDRLAVLPGAFCVRAAGAVTGPTLHGEAGVAGSAGGSGAGLPPGMALPDLLDGLVGKSLVVRESDGVCGARFRLLDTVRAFAADRLDERRETGEASRQHAEFAAAVAEEAELPVTFRGPHADTDRRLARLEEHRGDLTTALGWSFGSGEVATAARILRGAWWLWFVRGPLGEIQRWLQWALEAREGEVDDLSCGLLLGAGWVAAARGDLAAGGDLAQRCATVAEACGDALHHSAALALRATVAWAGGSYGQAEEDFRASLAGFRAAGARWFEVAEQVLLARVLADGGHHAQAADLLGEALPRARELAEPFLLGVALDVAAAAAHARGERDRARRMCEEALAHHRRTGYREGVCSALTTLGRLAAEAGDGDAAEGAFREGLLLARRLGHPAAVAACLEGLAHAIQRRGRPRRAARVLEVADRVRARLDAAPPPAQASLHERLTRQLRAVLGEQELARIRAEAADLDAEEMIRELAAGPPDGPA